MRAFALIVAIAIHVGFGWLLFVDRPHIGGPGEPAEPPREARRSPAPAGDLTSPKPSERPRNRVAAKAETERPLLPVEDTPRQEGTTVPIDCTCDDRQRRTAAPWLARLESGERLYERDMQALHAEAYENPWLIEALASDARDFSWIADDQRRAWRERAAALGVAARIDERIANAEAIDDRVEALAWRDYARWLDLASCGPDSLTTRDGPLGQGAARVRHSIASVERLGTTAGYTQAELERVEARLAELQRTYGPRAIEKRQCEAASAR